MASTFRNLVVPVSVAGALLACSLLLPAQAADKNPRSVARATPTKKAPATTGLGAEDLEQVRSINEKLGARWHAQKITPSPHATDFEFIRRVTLDLIGRIAKPDEIARFLADPPATRRAQLVERLLKSEEYSRNWANIWTVWLLTRTGADEAGEEGKHHEEMRQWLERQFAREGMSYKELVRELLTASGKSNENGAVNYFLAHLGEQNPPGKATEEGKFSMVPVTSRTSRLFLGLQIQCAQCHDHPNKVWKQKDFWSLNVFFRQVDAPRGLRSANRRTRAEDLELKDNPNLNPEAVVLYEQRSGPVQATKAAFLDHRRPDFRDASRRQELAHFITDSPYFAKAYVNRMWAHFFGRGFTNPVDDFGPDNEVSHPELLDGLAASFAHYGYDPRRLVRWICNSEAYGLSSVANRSNEKPEAEAFFSRMLLKGMTPEQLFESLIVATQAEMFESNENRRKLRREWMKKLTANFGDDEGNEVTFNGTVVQALLMMNGGDLNGAVSSREKGTVPLAIVTKKTPHGILDHLYRAALNRPPTGAEEARILAVYRSAPVGNRDLVSFWQDVFWALLNSSEFILNH
jgi:hypothetical protein